MNWRTKTFIAFAITTILFTIASILFGVNNLYELFMFGIPPIDFLMHIFWNISSFLGHFSEFMINYSHIIAITVICYTAAIILLIKETHKKTAWILAMIPPVFLLLNPLPSPANPQFAYGTILGVIQALITADIITAMLLLSESILPIMIIIYAITAFANVKNKIFDKTIGIIFIILFLFYPLAAPIIHGNLMFYSLLTPAIKFIFFIIIVILIPKMFKKD